MDRDDGRTFSYGSTSSATAVAEQPQADMADKGKPVLVTGAAGLVGIHTCRELTRAGWKVRALVRDKEKAVIALGQVPVDFRVGDVRDAAKVRAALRGCGAIVHLAAIAIERKGEHYGDTNTAATDLLIEAARLENVERLIFMSQNGAASKSPYSFLRSKGMAQDAVMNSGLKWTVLRPSVIFGAEDAFVNVLGRMIRLSPGVFPLPGGGTARFQPIAVDDVARVLRLCLEKRETIGRTYQLGGSIPLTLRQMTERILAAMGTSRRLVSVPVSAMKPLIALAEKLLPNPPVTSSLLDLLALDNTVPENALTEVFGIVPVPFAADELHYLQGITAGSAFKSMMQRHRPG